MGEFRRIFPTFLYIDFFASPQSDMKKNFIVKLMVYEDEMCLYSDREPTNQFNFYAR